VEEKQKKVKTKNEQKYKEEGKEDNCINEEYEWTEKKWKAEKNNKG